MDLIKALNERHSVRTYLDKPIEQEIRDKLDKVVADCNAESRLNVQTIYDEPLAFDSFMARYGKFSGVKNYVALIGDKNAEEKIGYYGEKIALAVQALGLNTCWVAMTYKKVKTAFVVGKGQKVHCVLALGYGTTQGVEHKVKTPEQVSRAVNPPKWFNDGIAAALKAPTAMNQQNFAFYYDDGKVSAKDGFGFYTKIDLGIVKYHFELGAGKENFVWAK